MKNVKIMLGFAAVLFFSALLIVSNGERDLQNKDVKSATLASNSVTNIEKTENNDKKQSEQEPKAELTHKEIVDITNRFMKELVQETDDEYKVKKYETIEAFIEDFKQLASQQVAEKYIHTYYVQEEDGIYVIPTSTPPWFVNDQAYETEKLSDNKIKVIQHNKNELYGEYTIELEFTFDKEWKITNTEHS